MTDELKPVRCGCGGEAEVLKFNNGSWLVMCNKCRTSSENYTSKDKAITAWNRAMGKPIEIDRDKERTAKVKKGAYDLMRCECGMPVSSNYDYCPKCRARLEWE
jgi:hypothetical protein